MADRIEIDVDPRPARSTRRALAHSDPSAGGIRSTMSPASKPRRGPRRAASACSQAAPAAAAFGRDAGSQQRADHPGEHVAGAGRGQPLVAVIDHQHVAARVRDTVVGPFSSTTHVEVGGQLTRRRDPVGAGRAPASSENSPSCGVITVGPPARPQQRGGPVGAPRCSEDAVAVDDHRQRGARRSASRADAIVPSSRSEPGADDERTEPVEVAEHLARGSRRRECGAG